MLSVNSKEASEIIGGEQSPGHQDQGPQGSRGLMTILSCVPLEWDVGWSKVCCPVPLQPNLLMRRISNQREDIGFTTEVISLQTCPWTLEFRRIRDSLQPHVLDTDSISLCARSYGTGDLTSGEVGYFSWSVGQEGSPASRRENLKLFPRTSD